MAADLVLENTETGGLVIADSKGLLSSGTIGKTLEQFSNTIAGLKKFYGIAGESADFEKAVIAHSGLSEASFLKGGYSIGWAGELLRAGKQVLVNDVVPVDCTPVVRQRVKVVHSERETLF